MQVLNKSNLSYSRRNILGINVDSVKSAQALSILEGYLQTNNFHHVTTPNTEMVIRARGDREFTSILNNSSLLLPDSTGVVWAMRWLYKDRYVERVSGADIILPLIAKAAKNNYNVVIIGRRDGLSSGSAAAATSKLKSIYPNLNISSLNTVFNEKPNLNAQIKQAEIVLVGLGVPDQDKWIKRYHGLFPKLKIAMGVGASIDFISGVQKRAPQVFRKLGLEWFWRLLAQPSRIKRQITIPQFVMLIIIEKIKKIFARQ